MVGAERFYAVTMRRRVSATSRAHFSRAWRRSVGTLIAMFRESFLVLSFGALVLGVGCGGSSPNLNQTSITCPPNRTLLDGVCVAEPVADYVACVRAQGAQLGGEKGQKVSADVGTIGLHAGGAAEVRESLEKKYSVSDAATLEIIKSCSATVKASKESAASASPATASTTTKGYELFYDGTRAGFEPTWDRNQGLENCRWNARTYPQKKVECAFDGQKMIP